MIKRTAYDPAVRTWSWMWQVAEALGCPVEGHACVCIGKTFDCCVKLLHLPTQHLFFFLTAEMSPADVMVD